MFTGIVTDIGEIIALTPTAQGQLHRLRIACRYDRATIADGASIACNGVCLTVVASGVDAGKVLKPMLAAVGGRGGGSPRIAQGSVPDVGALDRLVTLLTDTAN